jgi:hypothetical protein
LQFRSFRTARRGESTPTTQVAHKCPLAPHCEQQRR